MVFASNVSNETLYAIDPDDGTVAFAYPFYPASGLASDEAGYVAWLSTAPVHGSIPPGSSIDIEVAFDATSLINGEYLANLIILSNDPDEGVVTVPVSLTIGVLSIKDDQVLPRSFALHQNYPNPFNPTCTIKFDLPQATDASIVVYDILGREVVRLMDNDNIEPGYHEIRWNGKTPTGLDLPSGIYIARLVTAEYTRSIKMVLMK